jgi:NTP pyrophosphatase (non-canonical NTP hydrolase)
MVVRNQVTRDEKEGYGMAQKKVSEILKLVEFLNEEVKEVSKKLSRVTPKEVSEKLGALALLREKILNLPVDLPQDLEKSLSQLYPAIDRIKQRPS